MSYSLSLIDKSAKLCGSYYKLAKHVGLAESTISEIRKGNRRLPLDCVPLLADLCQVDVHDAIDAVMIEHAHGTKREAQLKEILGKALAAGGAGLLESSYSVGQIESAGRQTNNGAQDDTLYIVSSTCIRLLQSMVASLRTAKTFPKGKTAPPGAWGSSLPPSALIRNFPPLEYHPI